MMLCLNYKQAQRSSKEISGCSLTGTTKFTLLQKQLFFVVVVINPPLPRDGGTARTATQVHAVNLIEIKLGERWQLILKQIMSDW